MGPLFPATMPIYRSLGWELAGGKYVATVPARSLWTLAGRDKSVAAAGPAAAEVRRAGADDGAGSPPSSAGRIGPRATPGRLPWDEGPFRQWLARPDLYPYLVGDEGFAAWPPSPTRHAKTGDSQPPPAPTPPPSMTSPGKPGSPPDIPSSEPTRPVSPRNLTQN
jgi:hypothetical protein